MLADPFAERFHIEILDEAHSKENEDRWRTIGSYPYDRGKVLVVVWKAELDERKRSVTRMISARMATRAERRRYEEITNNR